MIIGLVKQLALLPVAPLRLTVWVGDKVAEQVEREQFSPEARMRQLREIEEKRERGELSDEAAAEAEAKIIESQAAEAPSNRQQKGQNDG
jgi:Gas vesicle protein G